MSEFGAYEHVVAGKTTRVSRGKQIGLWVLIVLMGAGLLWLGLSFEFFPLTLGIVIIGGFVAVLYMKRFSSVEYEYYIFEGEAVFSAIYGRTTRRQLIAIDIRKCDRIAPLADEKWADYADKFPANEVHYAVSSLEAPHIYFATLTSDKGKKVIVFFEMTARALRLFRAANPQAVIVTAIPE